MNAMPPAAIAVIAAALDDYRLTTPTHQQTPREAAERAAEYLLTSGWTLHIPGTRPQQKRPRRASSDPTTGSHPNTAA